MKAGNDISKTHFDNLDLLKVLAILMVLSLHVPLWKVDFIMTPSVSRAFQYAMRLVSEGVPVFVMINGFLLLRKQQLDLEKHLKILIVTRSALAREPERLTLGSIIHYILKTKIGAKYTGVLWFLQHLLGVYFIFPLLWKVYFSDFPIFQYGFYIVAVFTVGIDTLQLVQDFLTASANSSEILQELIGFINRFSSIGNGWYVFYFMLGGMISHYYDVIKKHRILFSIIGIFSWLLAFLYGYVMSRMTGQVYDPSFNYASIFMTFFLVGLVAITCTYSGAKHTLGFQRLIAGIAQNTLGIYLIHIIFIAIVNKIFNIDSAVTRILAYMAVFTISYLFSVSIRKIPVLRYLVELI